MSGHDHTRFKVISAAQHLYEHELTEFAYSHPAFPAINATAGSALDYLYNTLNPNILPQVATPADLPTGLDTPNVGDVTPTLRDTRIVMDDGDGKAAQYAFIKNDGDAVASWKKVGDIDWGMGSVISGLMDQTQYLYYWKHGATDYDSATELAYTGVLAGQHLYGGDLANQHLTLHANNGDAPGVHTGFIQFDDDARPVIDLTYDLGTATDRFKTVFAGTAVIGTGTMTITSNGATGTITDTSGLISFDDENLITTGNAQATILTATDKVVVDDATDSTTLDIGTLVSSTGQISFDDENLLTTGTLASGVATIDSTLEISTGLIKDTTGTISFDDEDLVTTGDVTAEIGTFGSGIIDSLVLDANKVTVGPLNTDLEIAGNGTGKVDVTSSMATLGLTTIGTHDISGELIVDDLTFNDDVITSGTGIVFVDSDIRPLTNADKDLGSLLFSFQNIFLTGRIYTATESILLDDLMNFKNNPFRDVARTQAAQPGDVLFYNGNEWLASAPDTEIDHTALSNLTGGVDGDGGHSQLVMLDGRSGGQNITGGTAIAEGLILVNNPIDNIGFGIQPFGIDPIGTVALGSNGGKFTDLYMTGQLKGSRLENGTKAAIDALFSPAEIGRIAYGTDTKFAYINNGSEFKKIGNNSYNTVHTNIILSAAVNVSSKVDDARNCIWQLCDIANDEEVMGVVIKKTATTVTITNSVALPVGNYRLIGIEV